MLELIAYVLLQIVSRIHIDHIISESTKMVQTRPIGLILINRIAMSFLVVDLVEIANEVDNFTWGLFSSVLQSVSRFSRKWR